MKVERTVTLSWGNVREAIAQWLEGHEDEVGPNFPGEDKLLLVLKHPEGSLETLPDMTAEALHVTWVDHEGET